MPMKQLRHVSFLGFLVVSLLLGAGCAKSPKPVETVKDRPQPDFSKAPDPLESPEVLDPLMTENQSKQDILKDVTPVEDGYATK